MGTEFPHLGIVVQRQHSGHSHNQTWHVSYGPQEYSKFNISCLKETYYKKHYWTKTPSVADGRTENACQ